MRREMKLDNQFRWNITTIKILLVKKKMTLNMPLVGKEHSNRFIPNFLGWIPMLKLTR